jgi:hypothetical protein
MAMYGDEARSEAIRLLTQPQTLGKHIGCGDIIRTIVDFAFVSYSTSFEGDGFDYTPMRAATGGPGPQYNQLFAVEKIYNEWGIKSLFDAYWRSQHWTNTVSQSDHCQRDELWTIQVIR